MSSEKYLVRTAWTLSILLFLVVGFTLMLSPLTIGRITLYPIFSFDKEQPQQEVITLDSSHLKVRTAAVIVQREAQTLSTEVVAAVKNKGTVSLPRTKSVVLPSKPPSEVVPIEDFSSQRSELNKWFTYLNEQKQGKRQVTRVAWFGDSFTEYDIWVGDFRDGLQKHFGGEGLGWLPLWSRAPFYHRRLWVHAKDWEVSQSTSGGSDLVGLSGYAYRAKSKSRTEYRPNPRAKRKEKFQKVSFIYRSNISSQIKLKTSDTTYNLELEQGGINIATTDLKGETRLEVETHSEGETFFYGMISESPQGVFIDNLSIQSQTGKEILSCPPSDFKRFLQLRDYQLVVLQLGLNIYSPTQKNYSAWGRTVRTVVGRIREMLPDAAIMLVGIGDRAFLNRGKIDLPSSLPDFINYQRGLANSLNCLFWDTQKAMGGRGSIIRYVKKRPPLAAKDHIHLKFRGGAILGGKMLKSMITYYRSYEQSME